MLSEVEVTDFYIENNFTADISAELHKYILEAFEKLRAGQKMSPWA